MVHFINRLEYSRKMVRGKVQLKRIENPNSRHATFSKRRTGLLKKAYELSVLCEAQVAVVIFSQSGRLYDFASSNMQEILERHQRHTQDHEPTNWRDMEQQHAMGLKHEAVEMSRQLETLKLEHRNLLGQSLGSCSFEELHKIEAQVDRSLRTIRARKDQLFDEQIQQLKSKSDGDEQLQQSPVSIHQRGANYSSPSSDILTELSIALPHRS